MNDSTVYVGLDYHQDSVQVCVLAPGGQVLSNRRCDNSLAGITAAVGPGHTVAAALEACAGAADLAEQLADQAGWSVHLAHPAYVHRLKQSPDKTDYCDAQLLADLLRVGYLPQVWLPPADVRELRRLVRYRQGLADQRRTAKLRLGALLREHRLRQAPATRWTKAWRLWTLQHPLLPATSRWILTQHWQELDHLQTLIRQAEHQLRHVTATLPLVQRLRGLRGIGLVITTTLAAEIGRFDRFRNGKQLARFCGLSPRNASSGQRQADSGLITAANPRLRATLIEAAWLLIRCQPRWRQLAGQLLGRGKAPSLIAAAVANRWVRSLHHQMLSAA